MNKDKDRENMDQAEANRDPLSGEPGAHPVGTGIGAASVGTAATVIGGVVGGPVGAVIGAVVGSVAGGLAGKGAAENVNPTVEDEHWRANYSQRPYVEEGRQYEDYQPAFRTGYEGYVRYARNGQSYDEAEPELQKDYETQSTSDIQWIDARQATRDAWNRAEGSNKQ